MTIYHVYILLCSDGSLYTGYTTDLRRRLRQHNSGIASRYTRGRLPVELVYLERLSSLGAALRRESVVKKMSRNQKLKLLSIPLMVELSYR